MNKEKYPPIQLKEAEQLAKNWREYYAKLLNAHLNENKQKTIVVNVDSNGSDIFRGFKIPLKDLKNILKVAKKYNKQKKKAEKINAVRAYLAMGEPEGGENNGIVHVLLLPVAGNKDKTVPPGTHSPKGSDLFTNEEGDSVIYDFTTPCPNICDTDSPLYKKIEPEEEHK
ncbi:hypothetical protein [Pedobacter borealis]|uniref:hypothetical protein n=1 Tax=Pedobacter borealis TaxID=475254 RepID=UPI0012FAB649|nr:hypothetical protein [Pedobacter borealis]